MAWQRNIETDIDHLNLATGMGDAAIAEIETRLSGRNKLLFNLENKRVDLNTKPVSQVKQKWRLSGPEAFAEIDSLLTLGPQIARISKIMPIMTKQDREEDADKGSLLQNEIMGYPFSWTQSMDEAETICVWPPNWRPPDMHPRNYLRKLSARLLINSSGP